MQITDATPLVLGSASPRRREMIATLGIPFVVVTAVVDETPRPDETPDGYLDRVTRAKLDAVRAGDLGVAAAVLVADTVVIEPGGDVLGKPGDEPEARSMIERLSGATHEVRTRFVLAPRARDAAPAHAQTVTTRVMFRSIRADEARAYAAAGEGWDKAGGYAIQGRAAAFVQRIDGSYSNVVGLPLSEVVVALRSLGWLSGGS